MFVDIAFVVILTIIGYRIIAAVPPLLHTPLMSGMNALSGVTVIGALLILGLAPRSVEPWAALAVIMGMTNVVGGFLVTERMLRMFRIRQRPARGQGSERT